MAADVQSAWIAAIASLGVAVISFITALWSNLQSGRAAKALAALTSHLADENDSAKARRDYEYEARKRLYTELYPLAYQLGQAARHTQHRIMNLALAGRLGNLGPGPDNWLTTTDKYYFHSVIHAVVAPLAVYELMTRKLTLLDLRLDPQLHRQLGIAAKAYEAMRSDYNLADPARYPPIAFAPGVTSYQPPETPPGPALPELRQRAIWRQGLYSGQISQACDAVIVTVGEAARVMNFAEFAKALGDADLRDAATAGRAGPMQHALQPLAAVFQNFHPASRPLTWRILLAQAACYRALRAAQHDDIAPAAILAAALFKDTDHGDFNWNAGDISIPPALRGEVDFAAEQNTAFDAANRFLTSGIASLAAD
jgi:hypothetical protein